MNNDGMRIRVPASTANVGSGFDSIGIAFQLYVTVTVECADQTTFHWQGSELNGLEISDADNLILHGMEDVFKRVGKKQPPLRITVDSDIPLTRGLGSSASAYVAGLAIANEWLDQPFSRDELLWIAAEKEGHPDNVGASIFGGVFSGSIDWKQQRVYYYQQAFPSCWQWIAAIPSYALSTSMARNILPDKYVKKDVVANLSRFGLLIHALHTENDQLIAAGLEDRLHQPYRESYIYGFSELCNMRAELGVLGFVISGAGPTVLSLVRQDADFDVVMKTMESAMSGENDAVRVFPLHVDQNGYTVYHSIHVPAMHKNS